MSLEKEWVAERSKEEKTVVFDTRTKEWLKSGFTFTKPGKNVLENNSDMINRVETWVFPKGENKGVQIND